MKPSTLSFEVQELLDIVKLIILLSLKKGEHLTKYQLIRRIDKYLARNTAVEPEELEEALNEMATEKVVIFTSGTFTLTNEGIRLSEHWKNLLTKREAILEFYRRISGRHHHQPCYYSFISSG